MRVIIAGSRSVTQDQVNEAFTRCPWPLSVTCVLSGGAKGADEYGEILAANLGIQVEIYKPEWSRMNTSKVKGLFIDQSESPAVLCMFQTLKRFLSR